MTPYDEKTLFVQCCGTDRNFSCGKNDRYCLSCVYVKHDRRAGYWPLPANLRRLFFATTFATSGITLIVTRLVTDSIARGEPGKAKYVTRQCLFISLFLSVAAAELLFIFSDAIGTHFLHDARTVLSLRVLAPGLPFMAVSACFRGYFLHAVRRLKQPASSCLNRLLKLPFSPAW